MKNILRKMTLSFLITPAIGAPLVVVACGNQLRDITNDLETTDLGYVSDLKPSTILQVFSEKNPKVKMEYLYPIISGNGHQGIIKILPMPRYYEQKEIPITYYSKLDFDENNTKDYELTSKDEQVIVPFKILDDLYDENLDGKIEYSHYSSDGDNLSNWIKFDYQIDKIKREYQVMVSLKEDIDEPLQKSGHVLFCWPDTVSIGNGWIMNPIILATVNLKIEV